jgi:hypothetical protein
MAEVTWALTGTLSARLATETWIYNSEPWIH